MQSNERADAAFGVPVRAAVLFGVVVPAVLLVAIYGVSQVTGLLFGNVVFWLTLVMIVGWVVAGGLDRGTGGFRSRRRPERRGASTGERDEESEAQFPLGAQLLLVLTGTVVLGWLVVLATL